MRLALLTLAVGLAGATAAQAMDIQVLSSDDPLNTWRTITYPGEKQAQFTVGIGSGAFRAPGDPADTIYTLSDRGPNFTCKAAKKIMGPEAQALCKDIKSPTALFWLVSVIA